MVTLSCHYNLRTVCSSVIIFRDQNPWGKKDFSNYISQVPTTAVSRRQVSWTTHLAAVPALGLGPAAAGNIIILGLDLGDNAVHVQVSAIVHFDND